MADLFAPKLQSEVVYERPVETPSTLSTLANLGESFVDQYGRSQRGGGASGSTSADPNLAAFAEGLKEIEGIRVKRGETAALIKERQLAKNFATAGIEFGKEYEDVYTTTTGRQWAGYGRDVQAMMLDEALKDPEVQASYISSFVTLPKDATEDQRIEYAIGQKATINAAADVIARSKAEAGYKWSVQTEAAYAEGIDSFVNVSMGSLIQTTEAGGRVGPQALANRQAQWSQQKVGLSRPPNITDQQWKSTQDKLKTVDDMFATLVKASSSDVLFEEYTFAMSNAIKEAGDGDVTSVLAGMSVIKDPVSIANLLGADTKTFIMDVSKSINLDITQPDLFSGILSQSDATVEGVTILKELPKEVLDKVSGLSPQEHFDALTASGKLTSIIDPNSLQRPDGRQQFVENATSIGAVMMSMENDEFLSSDFLKQLVANPSFLRNITTLDGVDPEGAAVARSYVVSGLNTELVRQQENLRAIEATSLATWTGTNYTMDLADLEAKVGRNRMLRFNSALQKEYGGDILTGVRDGFRRMYDVTDLVQISGLYNLNAANDRRNSIGVIQGALNTLNPIEVPAASDDSNNNLTPSENAEVTAAINEGPSLGVPLEDIDFDSNAPATPKEPDEEIVTSPIGGLNLDSSLDEILVSEGGFQNRPKDRGNYRPDGTLIGTNRGVTPNSLAEFRGVDPNTITEADIKAVTEDEARQIFKQLYFDKPKLNQLPVNLQEAVFDMQINSRRNAIRILQKLAGMPKDKRDGYVGPETLKALQGVNITNADYADARIEYYTNLAKSNPDQYGENLAGWIDRANKYRNK